MGPSLAMASFFISQWLRTINNRYRKHMCSELARREVEERVRLAKEIGIYADAGTIALIQYLKEQKEVYRR